MPKVEKGWTLRLKKKTAALKVCRKKRRRAKKRTAFGLYAENRKPRDFEKPFEKKQVYRRTKGLGTGRRESADEEVSRNYTL